ncbi:MAG: anti-sigma factor family protein [Planctomycetota bacterium]
MSARISCSDVEALLPAIADRQVDPDQAPDIFAHLASCSSCQEELAAYDLCSLALDGGREPQEGPVPVIHYQLPRWLTVPLAAAAALAIAVLLQDLARGAGPDGAPATMAGAENASDPVEILQVVESEHDAERLRYLIRIGGPGGETRWVDPAELDDVPGRLRNASGPTQVPVGLQQSE